MNARFEDFTGSEWIFGRADGSVIAPRIRLGTGGRIECIDTPNEQAWTLLDGNLCFLDAGGDITTQFALTGRGADGRRHLRGQFQHEATVLHVLEERHVIGRAVIPNPPPRVAVLVRTHLQTPKVGDLLEVLAGSRCFDVFVCADCTRGNLEFPGVTVLRHHREDAERMGLPTDEPDLMWHCGDYALYFAYEEIPTYDYYVLMEYDCDLLDRTPLLIEGLINRLGFGGPAPIDFVGCRSYEGSFETGWGETVAGVYPRALLCLFPFVLIGRRALEHLIGERRAERRAARGPGRLMFCEAFVPSALAAGGFRAVDINALIPHAIDEATFRIPMQDELGPILLGQTHRIDPRTKLIHPVYDEASFVAYHVKRARELDDLSKLRALVGRRPPWVLAPESKAELRAYLESLGE